MDSIVELGIVNGDYLEALYRQYESGNAIEEPWRRRFSALESLFIRGERPAKAVERASELVQAYRQLGYLVARVNPLDVTPVRHPLLEPSHFGMDPALLTQPAGSHNFRGKTDGTLAGLLRALQKTYGSDIGIEYADGASAEQREWLEEKIESTFDAPILSPEEQRQLLLQLVRADQFKLFLHTKYVGQKRFSLEGAEALIPLLDTFIEVGASQGMQECVLGMAHRGRLNVLAHTLLKPYELIFNEFEGTTHAGESESEGDVKYHLGFSCDRTTRRGKKVHCSLRANPSHLELIDPVVEGVVRAKQDLRKDTRRSVVVPVLIHGEAAFTGQGVVIETINLSKLPAYTTGGTLHIIVNNQLGFTASAKETRSSPYPTDTAKFVRAPIFHVNSDSPEAVVRVATVSMEFRQRFQSDVFIDLWCYRRHGHNETDDPSFTQPLLYQKISQHPRVSEKTSSLSF